MSKRGVFLLIVVCVFYISACTEEESGNFRVKNISAKIILGNPVQLELITDDFDAVKYVISSNEDTLTIVGGGEKKVEFKLKDLTVGEKKLAVVGVDGNGNSIKKSVRVYVFSDIKPKLKEVRIVKEYFHNVSDYTQGFFFDGDTLFESTGLYGESKVKKYFVGNSKLLAEESINEKLFGEGITLLNNRIYELTWKSGVVLVYDRGFKIVDELKLPFNAEGWGLTTDGINLLMSDGSDKIRVLNPANLNLIDEINVYDDQRKLNLLNELELVGGVLYANIYQSNYIAEIDIKTGKVLSYINCSLLSDKITHSVDTDVLNGIAYHPAKQSFFLTGKKWDKIFEVTFN